MEKRRIEVTTEVRHKIAKTFRVTEKTVYNALSYDAKRGNTDMAARIRIMALQNGGVPCVTLPECETIHDANGIMRQTFGNGARILVDKSKGYACWYDITGKKCGEQENITVQQLYTMQEQAAGL